MFATFIALVLAYLLGSVSSAILVCKFSGLPDPRTEGSKNPGATNVLRLSSKKHAAMVLFGDVLKGFIAVLLARLLGLNGFMLSLTAVAVTLGHIFPVFFEFKGGKGVATAFGAVIGLSFLIALLIGGIWLVVAKVFHYSSLAALAATIAAPVLSLFIMPSYFIALTAIAAIIMWTHRENIKRLQQGVESKIGDKNKSSES